MCFIFQKITNAYRGSLRNIIIARCTLQLVLTKSIITAYQEVLTERLCELDKAAVSNKIRFKHIYYNELQYTLGEEMSVT